jgi:hypothetical protein
LITPCAFYATNNAFVGNGSINPNTKFELDFFSTYPCSIGYTLQNSASFFSGSALSIYVNNAEADTAAGGDTVIGTLTNIYSTDVIKIIYTAPVSVPIGAGACNATVNIMPCLCPTTTTTTHAP